MPTRTFTGQQLIDWGIHETEECKHVVHTEHTGMYKSVCKAALVFRAPDDDRLWLLGYSYNDEAGIHTLVRWDWDQKTKTSLATPYQETHVATEVRPREVKRIIYDVVKDEGGAA